MCPGCRCLAGDSPPCLGPEFPSPTRTNPVPLRGCTSLGFTSLPVKHAREYTSQKHCCEESLSRSVKHWDCVQRTVSTWAVVLTTLTEMSFKGVVSHPFFPKGFIWWEPCP